MANAIKQNLEMVDVLQVQQLKPGMEGQGEARQGDLKCLPKLGETLKTDNLIQGTKIFTDATWNTKDTPGLKVEGVTGIGVYCQIKEDNFTATVMIQASTLKTPSVLQAEAEALLFAIRFAATLQLQQPTFLTDNSTLAKATSATSASQLHVPWEIRRYIAEYIQFSDSSTTATYHIKRDLNGVAHNCARQALGHNLSQPTYICTSSAHRNFLCPVFYAVQKMNTRNVVIHAVNCL
jgi:ribonuclease HI